MTRVRKVAAVSLMTSAAAAAIAFGLSRPASAVEACPPLASATINAPTGTVAVGSTVRVSAQINGLMLLEAHLQVSGQGLDEQVGKSVMSGSISGNVTVAKAGTYTLAVVGNGTKCTYTSTEFKAEERATTSPTTSWPGTTPWRCGGSSPSITCRSVRQTPQARTLTSSSPTPGAGTGRSTATRRWAAASTAMARMEQGGSDDTQCGAWGSMPLIVSRV